MQGICHIVLSSVATSSSIHRLGIMGKNHSSLDSARCAYCWDSCTFSIINFILIFKASNKNSILMSGFWDTMAAISRRVDKVSSKELLIIFGVRATTIFWAIVVAFSISSQSLDSKDPNTAMYCFKQERALREPPFSVV